MQGHQCILLDMSIALLLDESPEMQTSELTNGAISFLKRIRRSSNAKGLQALCDLKENPPSQRDCNCFSELPKIDDRLSVVYHLLHLLIDTLKGRRADGRPSLAKPDSFNKRVRNSFNKS